MKKIVTIILLILFSVSLLSVIVKQRSKLERIEDNNRIMVARYQKDSVNAAKELKLTKKEFSDYVSGSDTRIQVLLDRLDVKDKQVQEYKRLASETKVSVVTELRDTVIYRYDTVVRVRAFSWKDPWTTISGYTDSLNITIDYRSVDTLHLLKYWERNFQWRWPFIVKEEDFSITNNNPNASYILDENIEIIKK